MGNRTVLDSKVAGASKYYFIDMSSLLAPGEAVVSASVASATLLGSGIGTDIPDGLATVSNNVVKQKLSGGVAGDTYCIRVSALTNQSNVLITLADLSVISEDPYAYS